jgi:hypothetical protein
VNSPKAVAVRDISQNEKRSVDFIHLRGTQDVAPKALVFHSAFEGRVSQLSENIRQSNGIWQSYIVDLWQ